LQALNHWRFQARAKMFEIGVICIVVLAVGYWVTLWLMGRHEDVLHGDFIHAEQGTEAAVPPRVSGFFPVKPPFPVRPPAKPPGIKPSGTETIAVKPAAAETLSASPAPSSPPADRSDTLQALLASIKRDLKDASQL
jgi:hypothetical protein